MKKREYNTTKSEKKRESSCSPTSDVSATFDVDSPKETEAVYVTLMKELGKKNVKTETVRQMLTVTYNQRKGVVMENNYNAKDVVQQLTKQFPFLKNELVVSSKLFSIYF